MYGGAPDWRVHLLAIGQRGTGKTWLSDLVKAALGGGAVDASDVTEAGLRQMLTGEARAIVLDEAESEENTARRISAVIQLLRRMSDRAGATTWRGSAGGTAHRFSVTGCAYLAAILPPDLKPQDRSRITVVRLKPLPLGHEQHKEVAKRAHREGERRPAGSGAGRMAALPGAVSGQSRRVHGPRPRRPRHAGAGRPARGRRAA